MVDNRKGKIAGIVVVFISFAIFISSILINDLRLKKIYNNFPPILKANKLDNYVVELHSFKGFKYTPSMVFLTLDNSINYRIYAQLNPEYSYMGINDILEEGDKLIKNIENDTVFIIKRDTSSRKSYFFILETSEK